MRVNDAVSIHWPQFKSLSITDNPLEKARVQSEQLNTPSLMSADRLCGSGRTPSWGGTADRGPMIAYSKPQVVHSQTAASASMVFRSFKLLYGSPSTAQQCS